MRAVSPLEPITEVTIHLVREATFLFHLASILIILMSPTYINSMETYSNFISQFEIFDNPPCKKGYERHHIVPRTEQKRLYGSVIDQRQVYLTLPQHMWAHILYDKEHGTHTAKRQLNMCNKSAEFFTCYELCLAYSYTLRKKDGERKKKSAEACRAPEHRQQISLRVSGEKNGMYGKHRTEEWKLERSRKYTGEGNPRYGATLSDETKQKISRSNKGRTGWNKGKKGCFSSETLRIMSSNNKGENNPQYGKHWFNDGTKNVSAYSCPEGFVPGRLMKKKCQ